MAPVEVTTRTGRARRWKRSAKTTEQSSSWTRNNPRSEDAELSTSTLRGRARFSVNFKRDGEGRTGGENSDDEDDGGRRGRSPSPSQDRSRRRDEVSESDDRDVVESDYDGSENEDSEDDLSEGGDRDTSVRENEEDGAGQNNSPPPWMPDDLSPPYAIAPPLIETTASMAPSSRAERDISSSTTVTPAWEITVGPVDEPTATMTPVIQGVADDGDRPVFTVPLSVIEPTAAEPTPDPSTTGTAIPLPPPELPARPQFDRVEVGDDDFDGRGWPRGGLGTPPPGPPHRLAQGAEHALIAVGAIVDSRQSGGLMYTGTLGSQQGTLQRPPNTEATYVYGHPPEIETPSNAGMNLVTGQQHMSGPNNQPVADSQPSATDNAMKRQTYRDSEISSLSSGFGDGDIVIPQSLTAPPPPVAARQEAPQPPPRTPNHLGRFSWMSRSSSGKRETVYTQTSEDRPARFRSINSWVNQQAGRVRRADSRAKERGEVPVMPAIPGELNVTQQTAYR
ncbi:hypothetical protein DL767_005898 [Monosporascus sp. MG133]|nr:hypothetical protein DL767_005898 [Monosporascus sp. MG133]